MAIRGTYVVIALLSLVVVGAASSAALSPDFESQGQRITAPAVREHLVAFQRIADRNGGNRAAGTPGYAASTRYVAGQMRDAGYAVRFQTFSFPYAADRSPPALRSLAPGAPTMRAGRDHATFRYSGSGSVRARVVAVDLLVPSPAPNSSTSGCEAGDFTGFAEGSVALLQRGTCTFRTKVENAIRAGAAAAIVFNEGNPGRRELFPGNLGSPQVRIPALAASFEVGEALRNGRSDGATGVEAEVSADVEAGTRTSRNVIAETHAGDPRALVVAGAHLDSVPEGPGMNDNASGSAVLLEVAERMAGTRPRNRLRFVWWGAEELGLIGSRHYVSRLSAAQRRAHALYLNLDMVGSPNYALLVYDGDGSDGGRRPPTGSAPIELALGGFLSAQGSPFRETRLGGSSDHAPFAAAGIPVGGLFTGAGGTKSQSHAAVFGGRAGEPYDRCYHRACDRLANVNPKPLVRAARATEQALRLFARDVTGVRKTG